ncbi:MAG: hypothetical protein RR475_03070 [Clostridia bacterium]
MKVKLLKRIMTVCLMTLMLLSSFPVPVLAVSPEKAQNVNPGAISTSNLGTIVSLIDSVAEKESGKGTYKATVRVEFAVDAKDIDVLLAVDSFLRYDKALLPIISAVRMYKADGKIDQNAFCGTNTVDDDNLGADGKVLPGTVKNVRAMLSAGPASDITATNHTVAVEFDFTGIVANPGDAIPVQIQPWDDPTDLALTFYGFMKRSDKNQPFYARKDEVQVLAMTAIDLKAGYTRFAGTFNPTTLQGGVIYIPQDATNQATLTYSLRVGDQGGTFVDPTVYLNLNKNQPIGAAQVPKIDALLAGWKLDGYYLKAIHGVTVQNPVKMTAQEMADYRLTADTVVEIRTFPDDFGGGVDRGDPDNIDDRTQTLKVNYSIRHGDSGTPEFSEKQLAYDFRVKLENIPKIIGMDAGWKIDGYYIGNVRYAAEQLSVHPLNADTRIEIRTYPDKDDNGKDDRTQKYCLSYALKKGDQGIPSFWDRNIAYDFTIGMMNIPTIKLPGAWKLDGYYINGTKYNQAELAAIKLNDNTTVVIHTYPDENKNGIDDRLEGKVQVTYTLRVGDKNAITFDRSAALNKGAVLGTENVPSVVIPEGWKIGGYYIGTSEYTAAELATLSITDNLAVVIQTYPDSNGNGTDDRLENYSLSYVLRTGDSGTFGTPTTATVLYGSKVTDANVPSVTLPAGWVLDGYYINGAKYTVKSVAEYTVKGNITVIVQTYPDQDGNGKDDREKGSHTITFGTRAGDNATLEFNRSHVVDGSAITQAKVPNIAVLEGWVIDGYYVGNRKYTKEQIAAVVPSAEMFVEVRTYPDKDKNGVDDRTESVNLKFAIITGNEGTLAFENVTINKAGLIGAANVPGITVPDGWMVGGYIVDGVEYSAAQLAGMRILSDKDISVRTYKADGKTIAVTVNISYVLRSGDKEAIQFSSKIVDKDAVLTMANVPSVTLPKDWVLDGYYIGNVKYLAAELAQYRPSGDAVVEVRTYPDADKSGIDDRIEKINVKYMMRGGDEGTLSFAQKTVTINKAIGLDHVADVALASGWKLDGYYIGNTMYTKATLAQYAPSTSIVVEVKTFPDKDNNAIDDRTENITLYYVMRSGDPGMLSFNIKSVQKGVDIGSNAVAVVSVQYGWQLDGYYIAGQKYSAEQIARMSFLRDTQIEVRTVKSHGSDGPKTSDYMSLFGLLAVIISCIILLIVVTRKRKNK